MLAVALEWLITRQMYAGSSRAMQVSHRATLHAMAFLRSSPVSGRGRRSEAPWIPLQ